MVCSLPKIKRDSLNKIRGIVKKDTRNVSFLSNGDAVITYKKNFAKVKEIANDKVYEINQWSKDTFKTDAYRGQWVTVHTSPNDVRIEIRFPKTLEAKYIADRELSQNEQDVIEEKKKDALRAGLEYDENYAFQLQSTPSTDYAYSKYIDLKEKLLAFVNKKINILSNIPDRGIAEEQQIQELKYIAIKINKDIINLSDTTATLNNYFNYFKKDLSIIDDMITHNPTVHNLITAREFIESLSFIYTKGKFSPVHYDNMEGEDKKLFTKFVRDIGLLSDRLENKELSTMAEQIALQDEIIKSTDDIDNLLPEQKKAFDDLKELIEGAKDVGLISSYLLAIDLDSTASPVLKFIRKSYDDAVARDETYDSRAALNNLKPAVEGILAKLGFVSKKTILGKLYTKVNYAIFKRKTGAGRHKLAGKFNDAFEKINHNTNLQLKAIRKLVRKGNKDIADWNTIKKQRTELFNNLKSEGMDFIDIRSIPEIRKHPEFSSKYSHIFKDKTAQESEEYKQRVIDMFDNGNRDSAERIYQELVNDQLQKLIAFDISMAQYEVKLLRENKVESVEDLPETKRNTFLSNYYTQSPFAFSHAYEATGMSTIGKEYYKDGVRQESYEPSTMEYITYIPSNEKYIDKEFVSQIESDPTLYEAWTYMDELIRFMNTNKDYDEREVSDDILSDSLIQHTNLIKNNSTTILKSAGNVGKKTGNNVAAAVSTTLFKDKTKLKVKSGISTVSEAISRIVDPMVRTAKAAGLDLNKEYVPEDLPPSFRIYLEKKYTLPVKFKLGKLLSLIAEQEVLDKQELDLIDTITTQTEIVQRHKAIKEAESIIEFAKNQLKKIHRGGSEKTNSIRMANEFILSNVYNINNRKNWNIYESGPAGIKITTGEQKEAVKDIDENIALIESFLPGLVGKERVAAEADIENLKKLRDGIGRVVTTGSVFELMIVNMGLITGLGLNLKSQVFNRMIGDLSGMANDGVEYDDGAYYVARDYTKKWKIALRKAEKLGGNDTLAKRYKLTNVIVSSLNVFQNSANEGGDRIQENNIKSMGHEFLTSFMAIVSQVEKMIQRPQILAKMSRIYITSTDGTRKVPLFDNKNIKDPHPAFELDANDNLVLRSEFNNPKNQKTWIERNSKEYASLFGESGVIPKFISLINGDYRNSSTLGIKQSSGGVAFMMFKNWMGMYIMRRYGPEGTFTKLVKNDRTGMAMAGATATGLLAAAALGSVFPLIGILASVGYLGKKRNDMLIAQNANHAKGMMGQLRKELMSAQFHINAAKNTGNIVRGVGLKAYQMTQRMVTGSPYSETFGMSNEYIAKYSGVEKKEGEGESSYDESVGRINFILAELSATLFVLGIRLLGAAMLHPDDDEDEEYKKQTYWVDRMINHPGIFAYYMLENATSRMIEDITLSIRPEGFVEPLMKGSNSTSYDKLYKLLGSVPDQLIHGNYTKGKNKFRTRPSVALENVFVPKGTKELLQYQIPSLGFGSFTEKDYTPNDPISSYLKSDIDKMKKKRTQMKLDREEELLEKYKDYSDEYRKKIIKKKLTKEFPSINSYFNKDGSVKTGKKSKVEKYK